MCNIQLFGSWIECYPGVGSDYVNFVSQYLLEESHQVEMIRLGTYNKKDK